MTKKIIAIDIDEVLGPQNEAMRLFINEHYGLSHTEGEYNVEGEYWGYWERVWGVDFQEGHRRWRAFMDNGGIKNMRRYPDVLPALRQLERNYELMVVTARQDEFTEDTKQWLNDNFPDVFKAVHFVPVFRTDNPVSKAMICLEIGASYLIDDNHEHCSLAAQEGLKTLLFGDFGWSRGKPLPERVTRVANWTEVLEYFENELE